MFALSATACVGWFSAVEGWFEPWLWRFAGRVLGVRIEGVSSSVGMLMVRTWATVPLNHAKDFTVVVIGGVMALISAIVPTVGLALLAARARSPDWAAILTLMALVTCPVGVAARVFGERKAD
ncbi:MAG: hypothetical protein M3O46_16900 [Myxococcota bacterium]|nr:hypothetical protein [Myxococcota bacterium]